MRHLSPPPNRLHRQRGMTLIELMVAVVIFSFGMLGLAGLQTKTLSLSQSGLYRSQATALAADALDQMRSSLTYARAGKWNTALNTTGDSTAVTGGGIADTALKAWKKDIERLLPSGKGRIEVVALASSNSHVVTIEITWDDTRGRETTSGVINRQSFSTVSRL